MFGQEINETKTFKHKMKQKQRFRSVFRKIGLSYNTDMLIPRIGSLMIFGDIRTEGVLTDMFVLKTL